MRVVSMIGEVVSKVSSKMLPALQAIDPLIEGVQYEYGHINDINERLIAKGKTNRGARFPMIALIEDFKVTHGNEFDGIADLKIIILYPSKDTVTRQWREDNVFLPILVPIYNEFLKQLKLSGYFNIYDHTKISHEQIDRPHWGDPALYKNTSYLFGQVLDGIELNRLRLETYLNNCS